MTWQCVAFRMGAAIWLERGKQQRNAKARLPSVGRACPLQGGSGNHGHNLQRQKQGGCVSCCRRPW